jgi:hypothetical protein
MNVFRKLRDQAEADRAPGGLYDQMANYKGSTEYRAMLERNGGVAPGGSTPAGQVFEGPRGGKYTKAQAQSGKTYRRYI